MVFCAISNFIFAQETYEYRYWFDSSDNSPIVGTSTNNDFHIDIDTSPLLSGIHSLHYQIINSKGEISSVKSSLFYKTPLYNGNNMVVFIDNNRYTDFSVIDKNLSGTSLEINVASLDLGVHKLSIQVVDDSGASSSFMETFFVKMPMSDDIANMSVFYMIDNNSATKQECTFNGNIASAELDMSAIPDGLHTITFLLGNSKGLTTQAKSSFFFKEPLGGDDILSYRYWVNDDTENMVVKNYDNPQETVQIVDLLDLPHYPIRSYNFTFAVEDGLPVVYPKNTFNMLFQNAAGRFFASHSDYTDVTMREEVDLENIKELTSGNKESASNQDKNGISWFKFTGEEGDSISLYADVACSIDVFSPTGELIKTVDGYESIKQDGFFIFEDGTYYVALHDVKSSSKNANLNFYQLAKYAIVDYDIHYVGNGGFSTITFKGNGYYSLDTISVTKDNITIPCVNIDRLSNTTVEATFDFGGIPIGDYDISFSFIDDTVSIPSGLYVEEAKDIVLEHRVEFEPVFYIGHEPYYNITISNKGNNTAINVPVYIYIETKLSDGLPRIKLSGIKTPSLLDNIDISKFSELEKVKSKELLDNIGDNLDFIQYKDVDEKGSDSILIRANYFFINIPPMASKTISISVATTDTIGCYITIPKRWTTFTKRPSSVRAMASQQKAMDDFCCYLERIECVSDISNYEPNTTWPPTYPSINLDICLNNLSFNLSVTIAEIVCSENVEQTKNNMYEKLKLISSNSFSIFNLFINCAENQLQEYTEYKKFEKKYEWAQYASAYMASTEIITSPLLLKMKNIDANISCIKSFFSKLINCPPIPPKGGKCDPIQAYDPNDIHGYISPSGTHFVGLNQERLNYTIEFENDPEFATASAHTVILSDKLDSEIFDVESIHTSKIVLGEHEVDIDANGEFVTIIDLRPEINVLAEVRLIVDDSGEAMYKFTSLDPMTVEPTEDLYAGILPVNNENKEGEGYVTFDVKLKNGLDDGTIIDNFASIVFDLNEPIETPTWSNETDYVLPTSCISNLEKVDNNHIKLYFDGIDTRSGIWKYDLYYQLAQDAEWILAEENISSDTYLFEVWDDIDYGFCIVATDKAGNKETKELSREYSYHNGIITSDITQISKDNIGVKDNKIYDLQGRRVKRQHLMPGIYIINGKKYLIK